MVPKKLPERLLAWLQLLEEKFTDLFEICNEKELRVVDVKQ
jgi:hypothetical protein